MNILTIRTDKPEAEIGQYRYHDQLAYEVWQAHRELAETIHAKIKALLDSQSINLESLEGIVVFRGPGSFTGLRIGITVANALADALKIPIVGTSDDWIESGIGLLLSGSDHKVVLPEYGALPNITAPKK